MLCSRVHLDASARHLAAMGKLEVVAEFAGLPCTPIAGFAVDDLPEDVFWAYGTASGLITCCHQVQTQLSLCSKDTIAAR